MEYNEFLAAFEQKLTNEMLHLCTSCQMLDGVLLATDDINDHWKVLGPEYLADAVGQIKDYPTVSVAWAAYLGMAVAFGWDADWNTTSKATYQAFYGSEGFDNMDEFIVRDLLGLPLEGNEARTIEQMIRSCAQKCVDMIRREQVEPQSPLAYHVFATAAKTMYRIGSALELKRLGYKFEKVDLPSC